METSPPVPANPASASPTTAPLALLALLLCTFLLTASPCPDTWDGIVRFQVAAALVERGALDIPDSPMAFLLYTCQAPNGKLYSSSFGLGHSLLLAPFIALAGPDGGALLANALSPILMACGLFFFAQVQVLLGIPSRRATATTLLVAFTTPLWVYSRSWFEVAIEVFCFNGAMLFFLRASAGISGDRPARRRDLAVAGAFVAFALVTRLTALFVLPAFALCSLLARARGNGNGDGPHRWSDALRGCLRDLPVVLPFLAAAAATVLAYNRLRYGSPWMPCHPSQLDQVLSGDRWRGLAGLLASPWKSLLLHAPILLLAAPGWRRFGRRNPAVTLGVVFTAVAFLWFHAGMALWHGERSWGPRYLVWLCPWLCLPLGEAEYLWRRGGTRALAALVLAAAATVQFSGVSLWCIRLENQVELTEGRRPLFVGDTANYEVFFRVRQGPIPYHVAHLLPTWLQAFSFVPGPPVPGMARVWEDTARPPFPPERVERYLLSGELYNVPFVWWVRLLRAGCHPLPVISLLVLLAAVAFRAAIDLVARTARG